MKMAVDVNALVIQAQMDISQGIEKPVEGNGRGIRKELGDLLPVLRAEQILESLIQYIFSDYSLPITLEKTTKYSASVSQSYLIYLKTSWGLLFTNMSYSVKFSNYAGFSSLICGSVNNSG